jgi:hypothetical protein
VVASDRLTKDALLAGVVVRFCYVSSANAIMIFDFPGSGVVRDDIGMLATKQKMRIAGLLFKSGGMRVGMSGQAAGSSVTHPFLSPLRPQIDMPLWKPVRGAERPS